MSLTNYALRHEDVRRSGCMDPRFLDLSTSLEVCGQLHARIALSSVRNGYEAGWALEPDV
jgi:hypothetical protein